MAWVSSSALHVSRRRPMALCVASLFGLAAPLSAVAADTWTVTNCGDGNTGDIPTKSGTLRFGVANAASGDTVDLSGLINCPSSKISLATGEIVVPQQSLIIQGPGANVLTIDGTNLPGGSTGSSDSRLFTHKGVGGTLSIYDLSLTAGHVYHSGFGYPSLGGCIYSASSVTLVRSDVFACSATQVGGYGASGGGIYAKGGVGLKYSTVSGNSASGGISDGGGVRALGQFIAKYSTMSGNHAYGQGYGGGVFVGGNTTLIGTTISGNISDNNIGGINAFNKVSSGANTFSMTNSTISGNSAAGVVGGVYSNSGTTKFYYSTVAFNTTAAGGVSPGVAISGIYAPVTVTMQSTLMSNNNYLLGQDNDFSTTSVVSFAAESANNLVRSTFVVDLPVGSTKFGSCPLLGPLRDNGGLTKTHALGSRSPAIDVGNNALNKADDQRGSAAENGVLDYIRRSGPAGEPSPLADIGAYEVQQDEIIFNAEFEGCTPLI